MSRTRHRPRAALAIADRLPASPWRDAYIAVAAQIGPDRTAADAALAKVIDGGAWRETGAYPIAQAYALRGDLGGTLAWLERTWAMRDVAIHHVLYDPILLRFRDAPAFIAFCRKIGLPPPSESEALDIDQVRAQLAARR